jgi:Helix-turn-helix domain
MYGDFDPRCDDPRNRDEDPRDVEVHWIKLGRGPSDLPVDDDPRQRDEDPRSRDLDPRDRGRDPRDVFLESLDLPRGLERELVLDREHRYELNLELHVKKNETGRHRRCTSLEVIDVIRQMAGQFPDEQIAATLNRLRLQTGNGNTWNEIRVRHARNYHALPPFDPSRPRNGLLTLQEAAHHLGVSPTSVRRLIRNKQLPARQVVPCAPWEIALDALDSDTVREAITNLKGRPGIPRTQNSTRQGSMFSEG